MNSQFGKVNFFLFVVLASALSLAEDQQPPNRTGRTITNRDSYTNRNVTIPPRPGEVAPMQPALTPVVSKDPQTGEVTTHVVVEDESYPAERRTILTRDPRTGRTIAQPLPGRSFMDMETIIQRRIDQYRQKLQLPEDRWQIVQPLLANIFALQLALNPAADVQARGAQTAFPQPAPEPNDLQPQDITPNPRIEIMTAYNALRAAAADPQSDDELITKKMTAYIKVRQKYKDELESAQAQLRQQLTVRHQAQLTIEGVL